MKPDTPPPLRQRTRAFGLILIGNELLDGRIQDVHFDACRRLLCERHLHLAYHLTLPDIPQIIKTQLHWAFATGTPFFCCGGIGCTPDDLTRQAAAAALDRPLRRHPEGEALLRERFGDEVLDEPRLRMVDFPQGAHLVPNPYNQIPGFQVDQGFFLPGFPQMAHPMMAWILDTHFEAGAPEVRCTFSLPHAREADLAEVMGSFTREFPDLMFSSLPRMPPQKWELRLGIAGAAARVAEGQAALQAALTARGEAFTIGPVTPLAPTPDGEQRRA